MRIKLLLELLLVSKAEEIDHFGIDNYKMELRTKSLYIQDAENRGKKYLPIVNLAHMLLPRAKRLRQVSLGQ